MNTHRIDRRRFLRNALAAGAALGAPAVIPASALGADGNVAPGNRIALGFIGTGDHGVNVDLKSFLEQDDAQVVALCDVDARRVAKARELTIDRLRKKHPDRNITGPDTTQDWREIVARDDIDAVVVATPDHWHVLCSLAAARAGKDVFCEKPLSLTVREGRALADAVKARGRVSITGSENRSKSNFLLACELVRNGRIGKLGAIRVELPGGWWINDDFARELPEKRPGKKRFDYEMWQGQAPEAPYTPARLHWNWRWITLYSGGMLTDWGAHMIDVAQWGNDTEHTGPVSVEGSGVVAEHPLYNTVTEWNLDYEFANGVHLFCVNGPTTGPTRGLARIRFEGADGWIECTWWSIKAHPKDILKAKPGPGDVRLRTNPGREQRDFLDCVTSREDTYAPFEIGHRTITIPHIGNIAIQLGRKLRWNPDTERFLGDDAANALLERPMRAPWTLNA